MREGEEEVLRALLDEAFDIITTCNPIAFAPDWVKESVETWILMTHAMLCPNHEEVVIELLRMYNAASN